jgi:uncharacterized protein (TIGR00290 family)
VKRALVAWSSGKDCAWALHRLRQQGEVEAAALLTTFNSNHDRVAMHAVRRRLVQMQAEAAGLPLWPVELPWPCPNEVYEGLMAEVCQRAAAEGIEAVVFGDLFLEDVRAYRERQMAGTGLEPLFPLWGLDTGRLAREMIAAGQRAYITCVDPRQAPRELAGREFDRALLGELPAGVDPCGERGEFHTFVFESPAFGRGLAVGRGEVVERDGFVFADVVPVELQSD